MRRVWDDLSILLKMMRIALYSHDALGLGHIRRTLVVARALSTLPGGADLLVLSGAREVGSLPRPERCDVVTLPGMVKTGPGRYAARELTGLSRREVAGLRASVATAALRSFAPDLLVVDRHPGGLDGELHEALQAVRGRTRVVLGLRDVVDEPSAARREWRENGCASALDRWYDGVWVYGDRRVHDPTSHLEIPSRLRSEVRFTGYLARGRDDRSSPGGRRALLGVVGGGADGARLAMAFAAAARGHGQPADLVLGSQMPRDARRRVRAAATAAPRLRVHDFVPDMAQLLDRASAVVAMGGYNTACEVLDRGLPTLMVPRVRPRREQLIRAQALAPWSRITVLDPSDLRAEAVASWIGALDRHEVVHPGFGPDLDGLRRVREAASELIHREGVHVAV
jgi:predicted glycosyltransferase